MQQSIRTALAIPRIPVLAILTTISSLTFGWLLASDSIQPIVIYLLQIYLAF